jgi:hypothetical protein
LMDDAKWPCPYFPRLVKQASVQHQAWIDTELRSGLYLSVQNLRNPPDSGRPSNDPLLHDLHDNARAFHRGEIKTREEVTRRHIERRQDEYRRKEQKRLRCECGRIVALEDIRVPRPVESAAKAEVVQAVYDAGPKRKAVNEKRRSVKKSEK